jgi:hypothetical protein
MMDVMSVLFGMAILLLVCAQIPRKTCRVIASMGRGARAESSKIGHARPEPRFPIHLGKNT